MSAAGSGGRPRRRRALRAALFVLYALALLELASRGYWKFTRDVPLLASRGDWFGIFYRPIPALRAAGEPRAGDAALDVLLLGGSVLHGLVHHRGDDLVRELRRRTGREVRLVDLARPAHTLRDSLIKYQLLEGLAFDLVVLYHGINDTRMNNAPPERFRDDYGHVAWYARLERLRARAHLLPWWTLPFTLEHAWVDLTAATGLRRYVPRTRGPDAWSEWGGDVKTARPYRANLAELLDLARARGAVVLLATFAWYLPPDYTRERFAAGALDYALANRWGRLAGRRNEAELWGRPEHVAAGIEVHNRIVRELSRAPHVIAVDVAEAIPRRGAYFHDICHLSDAGELAWLAAVLPALEARFGAGAKGADASRPAPR